VKLLYGVQATGQGHISRARAMAAALERHDIEVVWLFSGRPPEKLFDMQPFKTFYHRSGLTFSTEAGRLKYGATMRNNNVSQFLLDVNSLDLSTYDAVVTDYEPVVAWAAQRKGVPCIGIGHQYAFGEKTPIRGANWFTSTIMKRFAPVSMPLGLHWSPYADNVLPPILDLPRIPGGNNGHMLVYLPFEDQLAVTRLLQQFPEHSFIQYSASLQPAVLGNVVHKTASIASFKNDLAQSAGVICNSGFELISECLQWGKPVLTRPLAGQMEQLSNGLALQQLGYATVTQALNVTSLGIWLNNPGPKVEIHFPNVAEALAQWLSSGCSRTPAELSHMLWQQTYTAVDRKFVGVDAA
jgi:uncharacterized protein (TIGR00661 family)